MTRTLRHPDRRCGLCRDTGIVEFYPDMAEKPESYEAFVTTYPSATLPCPCSIGKNVLAVLDAKGRASRGRDRSDRIAMAQRQARWLNEIKLADPEFMDGINQYGGDISSMIAPVSARMQSESFDAESGMFQ